MTDDSNLDDDAARWALKLDEGDLAPEAQAELDAWLAADPRRAGSLLRAEAVLSYLDRGRALAPSDIADEEAANDDEPRISRRTLLAGGSFAGFAAIGGLGFMLLRPRDVEIATAVGELRKVPLTDGSIAAVNTASKVAVAMRETRRDVTLEEGEAWFQVAHDKTRPFIVTAGNVRVRAVGTAFSVRRRAGGADVLVTEGVVEAWVEGRANKLTRIEAGSKSFIAEATPAAEVVEAPSDIDRALAWRTGELALNGESLAYAANELNRYNVRKLVIEGDALGREPLVGYFKTDQPENFSRAVARMVGARVEVEDDMIRISR